jgi:hypothetical protein
MTESAIQQKIAKKLRAAGYLVTTMPAPSGWPDIRAFGFSRTILIEVKRSGKEPSELQYVMMKKFIGLGYECYVMDNTSDIDDVIQMSMGDVLRMNEKQSIDPDMWV